MFSNVTNLSDNNIIHISSLQDEKNQIMTTNVWLHQVNPNIRLTEDEIQFVLLMLRDFFGAIAC